MPGCVVLVLAAGSGERAGGGPAKQYRDLAGRPVLRHSLARFTAHPAVDAVRVVIRAGDTERYAAAAAGFALMPAVVGGGTRQESARIGLESLAAQSPDSVLIHDAARPFIDAATITRTIAALAISPAAICAVPVRDTLKSADGEPPVVTGTVARERLWRAQTPQAFRYADILAAHRAAAGFELTDDAAVAEHAGLSVAVVAGDEDNFKLTTEEDFTRAARMIEAQLGGVRVGTGFDVHRFGPGGSVTLCGFALDHDRALVGHSDADVGLHALTDAILGALGAGDIGQHFPPSDARWRGAASELFLRDAASRVASAGGTIANVDVTLICEAPRIAPHRAAMVARVAEILGIPATRVGVKATTTEGLGFTGRGEGIAAQAVATLRLPGA